MNQPVVGAPTSGLPSATTAKPDAGGPIGPRAGRRRLPIGTFGMLLLAGLALRLVLALLLPPGYDEAYYLFYGRHPALSYFDHPAAVGLWAWLGEHIGGSILALRIPSLLSYTAASALLAMASRRALGAAAARWTLALTLLCPLLLLSGGVLLLPDAPLLLLLSACLWAIVAAWPLPLLGLSLGLLTLCKYQALLMLLCGLVWMLRQPVQRRRLLSRDGITLALLWLAASSPLWIWNGQNGWVSFLFQGGRTVASTSWFNVSGPPLFALAQVLALFPSIGLLLITSLGPRRVDDGTPFRMLLRWLALPQLLLFLVLAGRMQVLVSWLVPAWWLLLPLAGERLAEAWRRRARWLRWWVPLTTVLPPLIALLAAAHVRYGLARSLLPLSLDTSTELLPPDQLRQALRQHPRLWNALISSDLIVGRWYYEPGYLALALGADSHARFTSFDPDARGFAFWQSADGFRGSSGILFTLRSPSEPRSLPSWSAGMGPVVPLGSVALQRYGQPSRQLDLWRFGPLPVSWPRRYGPPAASPPGAGSTLQPGTSWPALPRSAAGPGG